MELSISNIAWDLKDDIFVYKLMEKYGYTGLEIAPTRIFSDFPYDKIKEAELWSNNLKKDFGINVSSMQSIWFGKKERIFGTIEERKILVEYTKKAINFACAINCNNLVFGCPRNRIINDGDNVNEVISFFGEIGDYASKNGTVIGLEAIPPIYNTNYINDTKSAIKTIESVKSDGFKLNFDLGTVIYNEELLLDIVGRVHLINHVHISEPGLKPIEMKTEHSRLRDILIDEGYQGYVSIEMSKVENISAIEATLKYVRDIFVENYKY